MSTVPSPGPLSAPLDLEPHSFPAIDSLFLVAKAQHKKTLSAATASDDQPQPEAGAEKPAEVIQLNHIRKKHPTPTPSPHGSGLKVAPAQEQPRSPRGQPPKKRHLTYTEQQRRAIDRAMDRFDVIRFEDLTGPDGGEWVRIGGGSFGVVFKGEYLGTPVAIKEVLPNKEYDVEKYFERECVLMKEARHPNIVQYLGLSKGPGRDGRIYIVSEYVGGNVRSYIADVSLPSMLCCDTPG